MIYNEKDNWINYVPYTNPYGIPTLKNMKIFMKHDV